MRNRATSDQADELHALLCESLKQQLQSGDVSASVLKEAREFLKDNGVSSPAKGADKGIGSLATLPFVVNDE